MTPRTLISAFLVFALTGCDGTLGGGDWDEGDWGEAAEEPEDGSEYSMQVTGLPAGTTVKVCKTNGASLNVRSGAGSGYKIVAQLEEGDETTILASSGSWYKHEGGGWSYHAYLCAEGTTPSEPEPQPSDPPADGGAGVCGSFQHPVPGAPVTSNFGPRWGRMHNGIDLGVSTGTNVRAAMGGVVDFAGWAGGYGNVVDIVHCGKYTTRYAHLSSFVAKKGAKVAAGQVVAKSGSTGNSTGPHLHFEIRIGGPSGKAVNPKNYISF